MAPESTLDPYAEHIITLQERLEAALAESTLEGLIIASGGEHRAFLDDRAYPFIVNPHFNHWVPVRHVPDSFILVRPSCVPVLYFHQPQDYWYMPASVPQDEWTSHWDVRVIQNVTEVRDQIDPSTLGCVGEDVALAEKWKCRQINPERVLHHLHFLRAYKTRYEAEALQQSARTAVRGHLRAKETFFEGGSEFAIQNAYLAATAHREQETPYTSIVAMNEHASVLHYQHYDHEVPIDSVSMLIDAGATNAGYAADITRTYARTSGSFADLVNAMDEHQQALIHRIPDFSNYTDLHLAMQLRVSQLLVDSGLSTMSPESQVETGTSFHFMPHGLGHLVGLQTHDVGGLQLDISGTLKQPPEKHPALRLTRNIEDDMVFTIEPGLYFIPMLLQQLQASEHSNAFNWPLINELVPYGGIRIEDNILMKGGQPQNLTRQAFAEDD